MYTTMRWFIVYFLYMGHTQAYLARLVDYKLAGS